MRVQALRFDVRRRREFEGQQMAVSGERLFSSKGAGWPLALLVVAAATVMLGVVQWMELLLAQASGETFCSINETFDCASVWAHPMAKAVQRISHVPVAGWGIVWSLGAFASALWLLRRRLEGAQSDLPSMVARIFGAAGIGTALALFGLSMSMGTYCLTCLGTYALVAVFGFLAFKQPTAKPLGEQKGVKPLVWSAGFVLVGYLLVLYPGSKTPVDVNADALKQAATAAKAAPAPTKKVAPTPSAPAAPTTALGRFLAELNPPAQQAVANALADTKVSMPRVTSQFPIRHLHYGPKEAKVKIVDFSDIRCGHCAQLAAAGHELQRMSPPGAFSQESRWFPLDAECNDKLDPKMTDGSGVRCAGARAMICLEGKPGYDKARAALFSAQRDLDTSKKVFEIAGQAAAVSQADLKACSQDPKTDAKLRQDVEYAWSYGLEGTPLVIINGRKSSAIGPFLYAMILAQGDLNHSAWKRLPAGRTGTAHEGHGH